MSGAKTRFGFSGSDSDPPDSDAARAARTVIGRDIHLPPTPGLPAHGAPAPAAGLPVAPVPTHGAPRDPTEAARLAVPVGIPAEDTEKLPSRRRSRPGGSRLARFLGRWTRSGHFLSHDRASARKSDLEVPRDPLGRNILVVLVVALLAFSLTFALVKLRQAVKNSAASKPRSTQVSSSSAAEPDPPPAPPGALS